ncbi:hypothetical protein GGF32_006624 [Allomyces javanicus]|nr:hypothetical protein GGF32_006624 [Allomyces javanicus]
MSDSDGDAPDAFELRLQFHDQLRRLTASQESLSRAARFAVKWRAHHDVLYAVLADALADPLASPNHRLNLFHLCDHLWMASLRANKFQGYPHRLARDLPVLVGCVCRWPKPTMAKVVADLAGDADPTLLDHIPDDHAAEGDQGQMLVGLANVPSVRKILYAWRRKHVLSAAAFHAIDAQLAAQLAARSALVAQAAVAPDAAEAATLADPLGGSSAASSTLSLPTAAATTGPGVTPSAAPSVVPGTVPGTAPVARDAVSRSEIFRRMEEDRERNKRAREESWLRAPDEPLSIQFDDAWSSTTAWGPEDVAGLASATQVWWDLCEPVLAAKADPPPPPPQPVPLPPQRWGTSPATPAVPSPRYPSSAGYDSSVGPSTGWATPSAAVGYDTGRRY